MLDDPLDEQRRLEHAAVEQHRRRMQEARALRGRVGSRLAQAFQFRERADLTAQKRRQVPRNARVLRIGQAELREAGARAAHRARRALSTCGKKPSRIVCVNSARVSSVRMRSADQLRAAARHDERRGVGGRRRLAAFPWPSGTR